MVLRGSDLAAFWLSGGVDVGAEAEVEVEVEIEVEVEVEVGSGLQRLGEASLEAICELSEVRL